MDIKSRIAHTKQTFYKAKHLFSANTVNLNTRKIFINNFVWNKALYGEKNMDDT